MAREHFNLLLVGMRKQGTMHITDSLCGEETLRSLWQGNRSSPKYILFYSNKGNLFKFHFKRHKKIFARWYVVHVQLTTFFGFANSSYLQTQKSSIMSRCDLRGAFKPFTGFSQQVFQVLHWWHCQSTWTASQNDRILPPPVYIYQWIKRFFVWGVKEDRERERKINFSSI